MSYQFTPPTHEEPIRTAEAPLRYYRLTYANSLVKVDGHYVPRRGLDHDSLIGLINGQDFFVGGCLYTVSDDIAAALLADGFHMIGDAIDDPDVPGGVGSGFGLGLFGSGLYGVGAPGAPGSPGSDDDGFYGTGLFGSGIYGG